VEARLASARWLELESNFLYGDSGMFIHNTQGWNSEGWKAMTQNLTFSELLIFAAKRPCIVATVNDAIQTMR
jgi:hypothetical protein